MLIVFYTISNHLHFIYLTHLFVFVLLCVFFLFLYLSQNNAMKRAGQ